MKCLLELGQASAGGFVRVRLIQASTDDAGMYCVEFHPNQGGGEGGEIRARRRADLLAISAAITTLLNHDDLQGAG